MLITFGDLQSSRIRDIASACPTSAEFASLVNAATRQLMKRGNFWGTVQPMQGCVYNNCITWPRYVETVLALNRFDRPTEVANRWYQFMQPDESNRRDACNYDLHGWAGNLTTVFGGNQPVFNAIPCGLSRFIRFYPDNVTDVGKTITLYGTDSNGQVLTGLRADGTWQDGLVLTLAVPYVQSPVALTKIFRVVKDVTNGRVRGYQFDSVQNMVFDLAVYQPTETSPDYIVSKITGCRNQTACCGITKVTALVKLAFVPVVNPDDLVLIEDEDALRDMVYSIKKKESGDLQSSLALELSAIRELNFQARNRYPIEQFQVSFRPFGDAPFSRVTGGFM